MQAAENVGKASQQGAYSFPLRQEGGPTSGVGCSCSIPWHHDSPCSTTVNQTWGWHSQKVILWKGFPFQFHHLTTQAQALVLGISLEIGDLGQDQCSTGKQGKLSLAVKSQWGEKNPKTLTKPQKNPNKTQPKKLHKTKHTETPSFLLPGLLFLTEDFQLLWKVRFGLFRSDR